jgi:cysteinyl-tRNA synthetase
VTRVTEHIAEIIAMVDGLVHAGHAYVSDGGSVYFDTHAFGARYGKLAPERQAAPMGVDDAEPEPGGGGNHGNEKRRARDFALWKAAHADDPAEAWWASPWGPGQGRGRPGWHIECSAMSTAVFGPRLVLHTGGIDLLFPHHENEIAQCEAFHGARQWVDYFLHTGHLHIAGRKMAKSLKNFITVDEFLGEHTADTFRMFCLLTKYNRPVDYTPAAMANAQATVQRLAAVMARARDACALSAPGDTGMGLSSSRKWSAEHHRLSDLVHTTRAAVDAALRNDFDTPHAMTHLVHFSHELSSHINRMLVTAPAENGAGIDRELVRAGVSVIASHLRMLGLDAAQVCLATPVCAVRI